MLNDILSALVGGATQGNIQQQASNQSSGGGDLLSGLLGSLMGGQTSAAPTPTGNQADTGGDALSGLLGSLLGGGQTSSAPMQTGNQATTGGDALSGLLGSLMGGGQTSSAPMQTGNQATTGDDAISGLLGSLLGGQTGGMGTQTGNQPVGNGLLNLVTSGQNPMLNSLIQPVVDQIANKIGIPPAIAMTVVTFAIHYMLSNHGTKVVKGEDISGVLQQHTSPKYLQSTGISQQLASQTGMKPKAAANALSEVFKLLGTSSPTN
jgi:hypothetical protein